MKFVCNGPEIRIGGHKSNCTSGPNIGINKDENVAWKMSLTPYLKVILNALSFHVFIQEEKVTEI